MSFTNDLALIADRLDRDGLKKEAAEVDEMLEKKWQEMGKYVGAPSSHVNVGWKSAIEYLRESLNKMKSSGEIELSREAAGQLNTLIDNVSEHISNVSKKTTDQKRSEDVGNVIHVRPEIANLAEHIAALYDGINQMHKEIDSGTLSQDEIDKKMEDIAEDQGRLDNNLQMAMSNATPEEQDAINKYLASIKEGVRPVLVTDRSTI